MAKSTEELMDALLESVKNKSVCFTLKKIVEGKKSNVYYSLKGLYSLSVHILIELEKGNEEYFPVLLEINSKILALIAELERVREKSI
jgi:hypothetical protein